MDRRPAHVSIPGVRFRATPVYSEARQLDALARFFYEEVLPRESDLRVLRGLFGLPPRVVDEVLADLVRLHFATLDVAGRRVLRASNPAPHPDFFALPDVEIWQDTLTGAVIQFRDIPTEYRSRSKVDSPDASPPLALEREGVPHDFREVPGARLVGMLRATSPKLAVLSSGAELETLVGRSFLAKETLSIPVGYARIDFGDVAFVRAPELPSLFTRSWSREVNLRLGGQLGDLGVLGAAVAPGEESQVPVVPTLYETTSVARAIIWYLQGLSELCEHRRVSGLHEVRTRYLSGRDSVLERLDSASLASVGGAKGSHASHVADLWAATQRYLLIVVDEATPQSTRALAEVLGNPAEWKGTLVLVESAEADTRARELLPAGTAPDLLQAVDVAGLPTVGLCIRDGVEVRLGSLPQLVGGEQVPRIVGGPMPAGLSARVFERIQAGESSAFLQGVLDCGRFGDSRRLAIASAGAALVEATDKLRRLLLDGDDLVQQALERARPSWEEHERDVVGDEQGDADSNPKGLRELESRISRVESLLADAARGRPLPAPLSAVYEVPSTTPGELLSEVARSILTHGNGRDLLVSFELGGTGLSERSHRWLLEQLLAAGCRVTLALVPVGGAASGWDGQSEEALRALEAEMSHHLLHVQRCRAWLPTALVVDRGLVVMGHRTWFGGGSGRELFLALEAPHIADQLWSAVEGK